SRLPPGPRHRVPAVEAGAVGPGAHLGVQPQQQIARRAIGAVNAEAPTEPVAFGADFAAMAAHARFVFLAPRFGTARGDRAGAFRLDELDTAGIGEGLLGGIDDLHHVAARAGPRELRDRAQHVADRA